MNIAILNWRDSRHPGAGGAEVFVHEVADRWADEGHRVRMFTSAHKDLATTDTAGPVEVRRVGRLGTGAHHLLAPKAIVAERDHDVVIESINTIPYFLPRRVGLPPFVSLVHQFAKDVWSTCLPRGLAGLAKAIEPRFYLSYRNHRMLGVSASTTADLLDAGVGDAVVVPQGGIGPQRPRPKAASPTVLFVGRLAANKRPDHAVAAFRQIKNEIPAAKMWIVGEGEMRETVGMDLPSGAELLGRLDRNDLLRKMSEAHVIVMTSVREGWGLVVTEANALGTPAVAYEVAGLKDSIRHGTTGLLTEERPEALATGVIELLRDEERYAEMRRAAMSWGASCSWDRTADFLLEHLNRAASGRQSKPAKV